MVYVVPVSYVVDPMFQLCTSYTFTGKVQVLTYRVTTRSILN